MPPEDEPPRPRLTFKEASFVRNNPKPEEPREPDPNDPYRLLQGNRQAATPGERPLELRKKRSRRKRDYLLTLAIGNVGFLLFPLLLSRNVVTVVYSFSGMVIFTIGATWVMWQVMDDY